MNPFKRKRRGPLNVAVFGSGPAGLFAAQAVYDTGNYLQIYSRGERSPLYGAQYLHKPIPGLTYGDPQMISYILKGTAEGYRRKVYGEATGFQVSPETLATNHYAYDIRQAYEHAWDRFSALINATEITATWLDTHGRMTGADVVIWALPLKPFCIGGHPFAAQEIWAQGDAPELGRYCSVNVEPWTVVTNGEPSPRWYRASNVFGHRTAEWPDGPKPPVEGIARAIKPIMNYCSCWLQLGGAPVLRVGRFGRWDKTELSHRAYERTRELLERV